MNLAEEFVNAPTLSVENGKIINVNSQNADVVVGPSTAARNVKRLRGFGIDTGATPHHDPNDSSHVSIQLHLILISWLSPGLHSDIFP